MSKFNYRLPILNIKGKNLNRDFDLSILKDFTFNEHLIYLAIKNYLANQRQGTHKSKERSEIAGSTRKLFRQKGTGGARRGDIKSPLLRGGGRIFGPKPRDYGFKINKNEKKLAVISSLKSKLENDIVSIIDNFSIQNYKTKEFLTVMKDLNMSNKKNLLISNSTNKNLILSSRNIKNVDVKLSNLVNVYDIVSADKIFFEEQAITDFLNKIKL